MCRTLYVYIAYWISGLCPELRDVIAVQIILYNGKNYNMVHIFRPGCFFQHEKCRILWKLQSFLYSAYHKSCHFTRTILSWESGKAIKIKSPVSRGHFPELTAILDCLYDKILCWLVNSFSCQAHKMCWADTNFEEETGEQLYGVSPKIWPNVCFFWSCSTLEFQQSFSSLSAMRKRNLVPRKLSLDWKALWLQKEKRVSSSVKTG